MRRFATLSLTLMLAGCGYQTWSSPPFSTGNLPYAPTGDSENLMRAKGVDVDVPALTPQAGDVWPGPLPPTPTLQDLEQQGNLTHGSSTPPGSNQPTLEPLPQQQAIKPFRPPQLPPPPATGQVVQTPGGPGVTSGGTSGYQTLTMPGGGTAIVVPNGNGTSTIIKSDGTIQTIPTPH
jgi:hypothetical protein